MAQGYVEGFVGEHFVVWDGHLHHQPPRWKEIDDGLISKSWQLQLKKK